LKVETWEERRERFRSNIVNAQYVEDLLEEWLPEFLEREYGLAACYVGLLGNQRKSATDTN